VHTVLTRAHTGSHTGAHSATHTRARAHTHTHTHTHTHPATGSSHSEATRTHCHPDVHTLLHTRTHPLTATFRIDKRRHTDRHRSMHTSPSPNRRTLNHAHAHLHLHRCTPGAHTHASAHRSVTCTDPQAHARSHPTHTRRRGPRHTYQDRKTRIEAQGSWHARPPPGARRLACQLQRVGTEPAASATAPPAHASSGAVGSREPGGARLTWRRRRSFRALSVPWSPRPAVARAGSEAHSSCVEMPRSLACSFAPSHGAQPPPRPPPTPPLPPPPRPGRLPRRRRRRSRPPGSGARASEQQQRSPPAGGAQSLRGRGSRGCASGGAVPAHPGAEQRRG
jgi:hypothetical protein